MSAYFFTKPSRRFCFATHALVAIDLPVLLCMLAERHAEMPQQFAALIGVLGRRHHGDVHPLLKRHLGRVDLGKYRLLRETEVVIAGLVKTVGIQAAEILHARNRQGDHAIEKFVHALAAKSDLQAGFHAFANFEIRHRLFRLRANGLLAGDDRQFLLGLLHFRFAFAAFYGKSAHAHGDDDLLQTRNRQAVFLADLFAKRRSNLGLVALIQTRRRRRLLRAFIGHFFGGRGAFGLLGFLISLGATALLAAALLLGLGLLFLVVLLFFFLRHKSLAVAVGNAHPALTLANSPKIGAAAHRNAMFLAIAHLGADPRATIAATGIQRHHVAQVDRRILLNAAALRTALNGAHML